MLLARARHAAGVFLAMALVAVTAGTAPAEPTPTHVHVTAAGDYGTGANAGAVLSAISAASPDANLALGDLSYGVTGQEQAFCDFVTSRVGSQFPFELLAGNHESNGLNGNIDAFAACLPNRLPGLVGTYGREYYVDLPQNDPLVRFIAISPALTFPEGTWSYAVGTSHYTWTAAAIDSARSAGIPWVVVGMHKPCISVGDYGCDPGTGLMNMLLSKKVDLVLTGHEHLYQRSKQLGLGSGCTSLSVGSYNASCVTDADSSLVAGAGTVVVTAGTGGTTLRNVHSGDSEAPYFVATMGANKTPTYGFSDLDITPDRIAARFGRGAGGTFSDQFTITKSQSAGPIVIGSDAFERSVSIGWGSADTGGAWSASTTTGVASVSGGLGRLNLRTAGTTATANLPGVSTSDMDLTVELSADKLPVGSGSYVDGIAYLRRATQGDYRVVVRILAGGAVRAGLNRVSSGTVTQLGGINAIPGLTYVPGDIYAPGDTLMVRAQATGTSPTTLRFKVWKKGTNEPSTWSTTVTDSTTGLQATGYVALSGYLSSTATNAPVQLRFDNLKTVLASTLP